MKPATLSPEDFVPRAILRWSGDTEPIRASLKDTPSRFIVEEEDLSGLRCTVSITSDMPDYDPPSTAGDTTLVTVVKRELTSNAAAWEVQKLLGAGRVTFAGQKDRWGITSQRMAVQGVDYRKVLRNCCPEELTRRGFFMKDAVPFDDALYLGQLSGNWFKIWVTIPGCDAEQIRRYVTAKLDHIKAHNWRFPNAYGRQRLGRRQNYLKLGIAFLTEGPARAIHLYLTDTYAGESEFATSIRQQLAEIWGRAEAAAVESGSSVAEQVLHFQHMLEVLEPVHQKVNMTIEYQIVNETLVTRNFNLVMKKLKREFSIWVGAIQGYWFNRALARVLSGELSLSELPVNDALEPVIPLICSYPPALAFYRKYFPEALDMLRVRHPVVNRHFFSPRKGPVRRVFVPVRHIEFKAVDGACYFEHLLDSGVYATTLHSVLFDLEGEDDSVES